MDPNNLSVDGKPKSHRGLLCAKCDHLNPAGSEQCEHCQSELFSDCHKCGERNQTVVSKCRKCGTKLRRVQRKRKRTSWRKISKPMGLTILTVGVIVVAVIVMMVLINLFSRLK